VRQARIDLVWFGVLLAVNMQTSFLAPPSVLRCSISAASAGSALSSTVSPAGWIQPYDGADLLGRRAVCRHAMVRVGGALVIAFRRMVLASLDTGSQLDPNKIQIEVPQVAPGNPESNSNRRNDIPHRGEGIAG